MRSDQSFSEAKTAGPRRARILDAAERVVSRLGIRDTTMEGVAAEAQVAKATLYSYFANKDTLLLAMAERVAMQLVETVRRGLAIEGTLDDRLSAAFLGRHRLIFRIVDGSHHAREIMSAKDQSALRFFERADGEVLTAVETALAEESIFAPNRERIARLLFRGAVGIGQGAPDVATLDLEIDEFIRTLMAGYRDRTKPA